MQFRTRLKSTSSLIDMTPLVDVIFLLLVFFIVTSDILPLKSLHIEQVALPIETAPLTTQLTVFVDNEEVIYVGSNKAIIDLESLQDYLEKESQKYSESHRGVVPTLTLNIDRRVTYDTFLQILAKAQKTNVPIRLAYGDTN